MEELDLSKAKEEAIREDWNRRLVAYSAEAEDELQTPSETQLLQPRLENQGITLIEEEWKRALHIDESTARNSPIDSEDPYAPSEAIDDFEDDIEKSESYYTTEGEVEDAKQSGAIKKTVGGMLSGQRKDIKILSDRKVQADFSFIGDKDKIDRVMRMTEEVIKRFTTIPGRVEVIKVAESGVFTFNVTNLYLSPTSDSSDSPELSRKQKASPRKDLLPIPSTPIFNELVEGIKLIPKFPGLPPKALRYGEWGLTPEGLKALKVAKPDSTRNEIIITALKLCGTHRLCLNLYKLP